MESGTQQSERLRDTMSRYKQIIYHLLATFRAPPKLNMTSSTGAQGPPDPLLNLLSTSFAPAIRNISDLSDVSELCSNAFPTVIYNESEKQEVQQWLSKSTGYLQGPNKTKLNEAVTSLNQHLSSRTTLLGSKPSPADLAVYARLAPSVRNWTSKEQTGEEGHHHVVRYLDFVQNSSIFGLTLQKADKLDIDSNDVQFIPKAFDAKQEKDRKKKERASMAILEGDTKKLGIHAGKERTADVSDKVPLVQREKSEKKSSKSSKNPKQPSASVDVPLTPSLIDLRVGHILKATTHPNADSLYVSTIACGDPPDSDNTTIYEGDGRTVVRTVCSGLNGLIPLDEMQGRRVIVVCNLKPVTMRGVKSAAMVLAASPRTEAGVDSHAGPVELVTPPDSALVGARVKFEGWDGEVRGLLNPKKKIWESCQVGFTTNSKREVIFEAAKVEGLTEEEKGRQPAPLIAEGPTSGVCTVKSLEGAVVR
ncbi:MAG: hypothetical protein M1825_004351 [Sarcosagium campestre]|nr:MAG: hypothetical protein M1825_004351 [Sarcosagium campestre]